MVCFVIKKTEFIIYFAMKIIYQGLLQNKFGQIELISFGFDIGRSINIVVLTGLVLVLAEC